MLSGQPLGRILVAPPIPEDPLAQAATSPGTLRGSEYPSGDFFSSSGIPDRTLKRRITRKDGLASVRSKKILKETRAVYNCRGLIVIIIRLVVFITRERSIHSLVVPFLPPNNIQIEFNNKRKHSGNTK